MVIDHFKLQLVVSYPDFAQIFENWMVCEKNGLNLPPTLQIGVDVTVSVGGWCYFTFFSKNLALCLHMDNISDLLLSDAFVSASNMWAFSAMHRLQSFAPAMIGLHLSLMDQLMLYGMFWSLSSHMCLDNVVPPLGFFDVMSDLWLVYLVLKGPSVSPIYFIMFSFYMRYIRHKSYKNKVHIAILFGLPLITNFN